MSFISRGEIMMPSQLEYGDNRATRNTYRFQEKMLTDPVIGAPYVQKVAELLKKIEDVLEG